MQIDKYCLQCGEMLPEDAPINKQYCSDACKQSAYRGRLEEPDEEKLVAVTDQEDGLHPLVWLGMIGVGAWLLQANGQTRNKPVTTRPVPPVSTASNPL